MTRSFGGNDVVVDSEGGSWWRNQNRRFVHSNTRNILIYLFDGNELGREWIWKRPTKALLSSNFVSIWWLAKNALIIDFLARFNNVHNIIITLCNSMVFAMNLTKLCKVCRSKNNRTGALCLSPVVGNERDRHWWPLRLKPITHSFIFFGFKFCSPFFLFQISAPIIQGRDMFDHFWSVLV